MWPWLALAHAGTLDDALGAVEASKVLQPTDLELVRSKTRPPPQIPDITTAEAQVELAVRWGTLDGARSCQRFEEMHEVLRRSNFRVTRAAELRSEPLAFGNSPDLFASAVKARVEDLLGKPWTASRWPWTSESFVFSTRPAAYLLGTPSGGAMASSAEYCPIDALLELRDEVVAAGLGAETTYGGPPIEGDLSIADELEVTWAELQTRRPDGDLVGAQEHMVALLTRRNNSASAVRAAQRVQQGIERIRSWWADCSGHHCSAVLEVAAAARRGDRKVVVSSPVCDELAAGASAPPLSDALAKTVARGSASNADLKGPIGELAFGLYAMGCVVGEKAQFGSVDALRASVGAMPADCAPGPTGTTFELLARQRAGIIAGCVAAPWAAPP